MDKITLDFKVGQTFKSCENNGGGIYKIHIDAIIPSKNEEGVNMIVYRYFGKHKRYWHYIIKEDYWVARNVELADEKKTI